MMAMMAMPWKQCHAPQGACHGRFQRISASRLRPSAPATGWQWWGSKGLQKISKITPARGPKQWGGRKVNVPDTTAEVRHDRNYSSRTFYIDLFRGSHKVFRQELPRNPPGRTCTQAGCHQDPHKIFSQGPVRDHVRTPRRFHQDFAKSFSHGPVQDHPKASGNMSLGSPQDLHRIFSQGCVKDHDQDLHARTPKRSSQDRHKRPCCWRGPYKILIQEPTKSIPEELSYKHV